MPLHDMTCLAVADQSPSRYEIDATQNVEPVFITKNADIVTLLQFFSCSLRLFAARRVHVQLAVCTFWADHGTCKPANSVRLSDPDDKQPGPFGSSAYLSVVANVRSRDKLTYT